MNRQSHIGEQPEFPLRLVKYLSSAGIASRRKCADMIKSGRVKVNGTVVRDPGFQVQREDSVICGNDELKISMRYYIILNKPRGYFCTSSDPHADKIALDLIKLPDARLFSVGRLDKDSEGLLLFTNDGDYAERLTHPRYNVLKTYEVTTDRSLKRCECRRLCEPIEDSGEILRVHRIRKLDSNTYIFIMGEGKKREIRRLVRSVGAKVKRLRRIAIGRLFLGNLPSGKWRFLTEDEINLSLETENN